MSLFEDSGFQWRETYFILFPIARRPTAAMVHEALQRLDARYRLSELQQSPQADFESVTLKSPDDFAAMDISYMQGDEVQEQVQDLLKSARAGKKSDTLLDAKQAALLATCDARLDVLHFEQITEAGAGHDDEEFLDPGALLVVLERLRQICHGLVIDPQSGCVM
ncbi:MAG: hypothetical protein O2931_05890 [Planctomycetota bacterium]|nr:hypothetical protein [Planctomycetota bacterium]MDA1178315.1 hypothetical protein [Planctomycetota bacterium]